MQKVLLLILDGWGYNPGAKSNAIEAANTPCYDSLIKNNPHTFLNASGVFVGLPDGIMGNSEVGHENIGAGRINKQKLTLISDLVKTGEFFDNKVLLGAFDHALRFNSRVHLMGLISEGDVHSHLGHLDALIEFASRKKLDETKLFLHAISDGRDDPPYVAGHLMQRYETKINIATVAGRYWAMDRDNNWDRIEKYYQCVVSGLGLESSSGSQAILDAYALARSGANPTGDSDEFVFPTIVNKNGLIEENDVVVFFNFRPDRAREISKRLGMESGIKNLHYVCFTDYSSDIKLPVAFSSSSLQSQNYSNTLGELVSKAGYKQFRIAETEKFNHVTMFFNSGRKAPWLGEERLLVPSPKVATYDLQPEMSLPGVTEELLKAMSNNDYRLIVCNFANPDMVGHTGKWDAVVRAIEEVDKSLEEVVTLANKTGHVIMLTADHGNADQMSDLDGSVRTAHSCNPVPFIIINSRKSINLTPFKSNPEALHSSPSLSNIAPTILEYLEIEKPSDMTADSLIL